MLDLSKYKQNPKTQYLAENLERLLKEEADILVLQKEEGMGELADADLKNIELQKDILINQMEEILKEEEKELIDKAVKESGLTNTIHTRLYIEKYFNKKLKCLITDGSQPIGNGIGPSLEIIDTIKILDPKQRGPHDLEEKSLVQSGAILEMTGRAKKGKGIEMAREILYSGKAYEKFKEIIKAQNGNLENLKKSARFKKDIFSPKNLVIKEIDNRKINSLARISGCPVDKFSGVYLYNHVNDRVLKRKKLLTIHSETQSRLRQAVKFYHAEKPIKFK